MHIVESGESNKSENNSDNPLSELIRVINTQLFNEEKISRFWHNIEIIITEKVSQVVFHPRNLNKLTLESYDA